MFASSVNEMAVPATSGCTSVIDTGCPIASLTTCRWPARPCNSALREYSSPASPLPSVPTTPSTCAASVPRGYTRRITGAPATPGIFSASTCRACLAGSARARYTNPLCSESSRKHRRLRLAQQRREPRGGVQRIVDEVGGRRDVLRRLGDRQVEAVAVSDRPALSRYREVGELLGGGGLLQAPALQRAEIQGAPARQDQQEEEQPEDPPDPALDDRHAPIPPEPRRQP